METSDFGPVHLASLSQKAKTSIDPTSLSEYRDQPNVMGRRPGALFAISRESGAVAEF
ncbi:hypothetical protein [Azospirillum soli]|uniref:hypothetical protein n=1 Tax=Azospirillum soli TaxID=1304799 RepID=UPI001AE741E3|nr:hypothetical protein [Azospirillum soli]MBP2315070.1 hypothetical protein [Azospirillum soli]